MALRLIDISIFNDTTGSIKEKTVMKRITVLTGCILFVSSHVFAADQPKNGITQHSVQVHNNSLSFYYNDAKAKEILFSSSANHFNCQPAMKGPGNVWQVTVPLNKEFSYFYIVDGETTLPDCINTELDDFGAKNCLYLSSM